MVPQAPSSSRASTSEVVTPASTPTGSAEAKTTRPSYHSLIMGPTVASSSLDREVSGPQAVDRICAVRIGHKPSRIPDTILEYVGPRFAIGIPHPSVIVPAIGRRA